MQHWLNMVADAPQMLAVCEEYDQASINRSPLGSGLMTGKFNRDSTFPEDDVRHGWDLQTERTTLRIQRIEAVRKLFAEVGDPRTQAQVAIAWIWARSERTIPIPGFKTVAQVRENTQAMEFGPLSKELLMKIEEIFERTSVIA